MKTLLIMVTWLQGAPLVQTELMDSPSECRMAAKIAVQMIRLKARTNMTSPHNELSTDYDEKTGEWRLLTGGVGREVAKLRCSGLDAIGR